ncbi:MAG: tetratricopeptide repeat protein, partial [Acidobacteria bacterium]|nr:tetratricopeptide repeat protein [Acidobacteriota bacterium]
TVADVQRLRQQVAELEGLLADNPNDAGLMAAMGNIYFDASRWPDARDWYEKALQVSSGDPNIFTDLAVVYRNLGEFQRSIEFLDQAIAIDSGHWQAWYNKVVVYQFDLHQHDDAADALKTLQELKKSNSSIPDLSGLESEVFGG